jgi:histidine triad (HIT) family protein
MDANCIFCRIAAGEIPSQRVYEDERMIAIRDINPAAPVHVLVVPREHIASLAELEEGQRDLAGHLLWGVAEVARREGVAERGYRTVINTGEEGGQTVAHLHIHLLAGRQLSGHGTG